VKFFYKYGTVQKLIFTSTTVKTHNHENELLELLDRQRALITQHVLDCTSVCDNLPTARSRSSLPRDGLRVLIVDSDADSYELLAVLFAHYGFKTTIATCASEAIKQIHQTQPDLLISEIFLPGEDGYSLIRQVKTVETALHVQIPAIALTTVSAGEQDQAYPFAAGFCRYLLKPIDIDKLMAAIACVIGQTHNASVNPCP